MGTDIVVPNETELPIPPALSKYFNVTPVVAPIAVAVMLLIFITLPLPEALLTIVLIPVSAPCPAAPGEVKIPTTWVDIPVMVETSTKLIMF